MKFCMEIDHKFAYKFWMKYFLSINSMNFVVSIDREFTLSKHDSYGTGLVGLELPTGMWILLAAPGIACQSLLFLNTL